MESYENKIDKYISLILKWNKTHNLVSRSDIAKSSANDLKARHIDDSEQLLKYMPENIKTICDLGSGGGLPAIVIALKLIEKESGTKVSAVESNLKKSVFLRNCRRELGLENFNPLAERIENLDIEVQDVITARAFADLKDIFEITKKFRHENTKFILLKGETIKEEVKVAEKLFDFSYDLYPSETGNGFILCAQNIKAKAD